MNRIIKHTVVVIFFLCVNACNSDGVNPSGPRFYVENNTSQSIYITTFAGDSPIKTEIEVVDYLVKPNQKVLISALPNIASYEFNRYVPAFISGVSMVMINGKEYNEECSYEVIKRFEFCPNAIFFDFKNWQGIDRRYNLFKKTNDLYFYIEDDLLEKFQ